MGLKTKDLADKVGVRPEYISMIESGKRRNLSHEKWLKLCEALGVPLDHFAKYISPDVRVPPPPFPGAMPVVHVEGYELPLLGTVAAGPDDEPELFEPPQTYRNAERFGPGCFALLVKGQSCQAAGVPDGALVVVDPNRAPQHGQLVVAQSADGFMLKIYLDGVLHEFRPGQEKPKAVRAKKVELKGVVVNVECRMPRFSLPG